MVRAELRPDASIADLEREYSRVERLLFAADLRDMQSFDKPYGVQDRIARTCSKHRATLRRIESRIEALKAAEAVS